MAASRKRVGFPEVCEGVSFDVDQLVISSVVVRVVGTGENMTWRL